MFLVDAKHEQKECTICAEFNTPILTYVIVEFDTGCMLLRTLEPGEYLEYYLTRQNVLYSLINDEKKVRDMLLTIDEGSKEKMRESAQFYSSVVKKMISMQAGGV